jgi:HD-GYP domain-containing protein (c-di-GMP phosphodiesterase class II)
MTIELMLRVIGYLSLLGAIAYLAYLFAPPALTERLARHLKALRLEEEDESPLDLPAWGRYMSDREGYDSEHAARIAMIARKLGQAAGLPPDVLDTLSQAGYLHDVGEEDLFPMLDKPSPLTPAERDQLHEHPLLGERLAHDIGLPPEPALWIRWHHERVDGTGYPDGLMGDAIPLPARVLAIAEAYEAITHRRPYREALEPDEAMAELQRLAGIAYDAHLIDCFAEVVYPHLLTPPPAE